MNKPFVLESDIAAVVSYGLSEATSMDDRLPDVHEYSLGDEVVCFDSASERLLVANAVGAAIWRLWIRDVDPDVIVSSLADVFDIEKESERLVTDVTGTIASLELGGDFRFNPVPDYEPCLDPVPDRALRALEEHRVGLPGGLISVRAENPAVGQGVASLFPLRIDESSMVGIDVDIYSEGGRYPIVHDGRTLDTGFSPSDTIVKAVREIGGLMLRREPWTAIVHASAVARDGKSVLFPAVGGSGKTTLSAWLIAKGYRLLNDDAVPICATTGTLRSVPVPLSVKTGSLAVLEPLWPDLASLPAHGKGERVIRYQAVPSERACLTDTVCALIALPRWDPNLVDAATIEPVAPSGVLRDIVEGGCTMRRPLDPSAIGALITWLARTPCVRLTYRDLDAARALLDAELLGG